MAMEAGSNSLFQCFKLPQLSADLSDPELDANGEPLRQRRSRGKSRTGCDKCKERKVKVRKRTFPTRIFFLTMKDIVRRETSVMLELYQTETCLWILKCCPGQAYHPSQT